MLEQGNPRASVLSRKLPTAPWTWTGIMLIFGMPVRCWSAGILKHLKFSRRCLHTVYQLLARLFASRYRGWCSTTATLRCTLRLPRVWWQMEVRHSLRERCTYVKFISLSWFWFLIGENLSTAWHCSSCSNLGTTEGAPSPRRKETLHFWLRALWYRERG